LTLLQSKTTQGISLLSHHLSHGSFILSRSGTPSGFPVSLFSMESYSRLNQTMISKKVENLRMDSNFECPNLVEAKYTNASKWTGVFFLT
jgi:hypothetical protein